MQSYVLQAFEIVATTGVERRHSNRSSPAGLEYTKKEPPIGCLFSVSLKARDVAERPGDVRLRRPERSVDIRTVQTRQGSNTQETCCPLDDPFILVTYPHFICIANSFSTEKEDTHTGYPQKASTRRDSNPRPSPWQGDTPPLSHSCIGNIPSKPHIELHQPLNLHLTFLDKPSTD